MNVMERKNTELIKEFNRYIREHPELADNIPSNAVNCCEKMKKGNEKRRG